jgi:hypothetical protein
MTLQLRMFRVRAFIVATFCAIGFGVIFCATSTLWHYGIDGPLTNAIDFRAFYCAGSALDGGHDPYLEEPVRSCERATLHLAGFSSSEKDVLVAPYPPLALAVFGALARLPYRIAVELWLTLCLSAVCIAIFTTAALTRFRPLYVAVALVPSVGFALFFFGQPVPIVVAALVIAAFAARSGPGWIAAAGLVVAFLQPHLALPAAIAAAILVPRVRRPLAIAALALVALSLVLFGPLTYEYASVTLPLHSRAEVTNFTDQYGLSALLYRLGVPIPTAMLIGSLSYLFVLGLGIVVAARLIRSFRDRAFALLAPSALITTGGPFIHAHQIAVALPFALLLFASVRQLEDRVVQIALGLAIVGLAVPWSTIADQPGVNEILPHQAYVRPGPFRIPSANEPIDRGYAEREDALANSNERTPAVQIAWKLPTWGALLILLCSSLVLARRRFDHSCI